LIRASRAAIDRMTIRTKHQRVANFLRSLFASGYRSAEDVARETGISTVFAMESRKSGAPIFWAKLYANAWFNSAFAVGRVWIDSEVYLFFIFAAPQPYNFFIFRRRSPILKKVKGQKAREIRREL